MGLLDDTAVFMSVIKEGGFSHAAKRLGLSSGYISRRIAQLETELGVTLIKRTTRQLQLTDEGKLFFQHAERIQHELNSVLCLLQTQTEKPKGKIRISAPIYFGRTFLLPILNKFLDNFENIEIDLVLTNKNIDPIKENMDLLFRSAGFRENLLADSNMKAKLLVSGKICLYATTEYLLKHGEVKTPEDLAKHHVIGYVDTGIQQEDETWHYTLKGKKHSITLKPKFRSNDVESALNFCLAHQGIGRFSEMLSCNAVQQQKLQKILPDYTWGEYDQFVLYSNQSIPKRVRLLLDYIDANLKQKTEPV